jgi:hypothetical protein
VSKSRDAAGRIDKFVGRGFAGVAGTKQTFMGAGCIRSAGKKAMDELVSGMRKRTHNFFVN